MLAVHRRKCGLAGGWQAGGRGCAGQRMACLTSMRRRASSAATSSRTNGRFLRRMRCISLRILGRSRSVRGCGMSKS